MMVSSLVNMTEIAANLGVTAKQVWAWQRRRYVNYFPEPKTHGRSYGARGGPKSGPLFDMEEVYEWHANYVPAKGGAPKGSTHGFQEGNYMGMPREDA